MKRSINLSFARAALVALLGFTPSIASAGTIIDTIQGSIFIGGAGVSVDNFNGNGQMVALPFSSSAETTITGLDVYLGLENGKSGSFDLGIMADVSGLPSGTFLDDIVVSSGPVAAPVILNSLSWSIAVGTPYWLAAIATTDGNNGAWNLSGLPGFYAFGQICCGWTGVTDFLGLPAAIITGEAGPVPVPEPTSLVSVVAGLVGLGVIRRRRKNKAA